ncbi:MAG: aminotransferase class I/II-fold pyridoxal phosphate-dependent enzyme [Porticoccaceae bacterium]
MAVTTSTGVKTPTGVKTRRLADRVAEMTSFKVVDFLEAAERLQAEGRDIVRLEAGQPAFATPQLIVEAAETALRDEKTKYTSALGIAELRRAISDLYRQRNGIAIAPERIVVTTGSSAALSLIGDLLINPGDGVLVTDPGYPCNANFIRRAGGEPQAVPVEAAERYQLTEQATRAHWQANTIGALLASPSNPTGELMDRAHLEGIHKFIASQGGTLVVDEIYHGLVYERDETSILEITDEAFVINSFSKYFGMTGWRLGWMVVPEDVVDVINTMAQNFYISPPSIAQYAALAAFQPSVIAEMEARREELQRRRDFLVPALKSLGFGIPFTPAGAFYIYADISALMKPGMVDSEAFCWDMLERAGVAFTPGTDFGEHLAQSHVRFTYTEPMERLELAVERLSSALGSRG